jgi:F0F1-type ATP synthase membrane subunit c/vacuolar-type H+-ATPase subunit K
MPPAPPAPGSVHAAVTDALAATANESDTVKAAAVGAAASAAAGLIPSPNSRTTNFLWIVLVSTLGIVVLVSAIMGVVYALVNKAAPPEVVITIFTTGFSGLIGLFVKPPATS